VTVLQGLSYEDYQIRFNKHVIFSVHYFCVVVCLLNGILVYFYSDSGTGTGAIGADTVGELATDKWTFVSIVFTNHSAAHAAAAVQERAGTVRAKRKPENAEDRLAPTGEKVVGYAHHTPVGDGGVDAAGVRVAYPAPGTHSRSENEIDSGYEDKGAAKVQRDDEERVHRQQMYNAFKATGLPSYSISVFLNGVLDIKIDFPALVLSNEEPYSFFKDQSFEGTFLLFQYLVSPVGFKLMSSLVVMLLLLRSSCFFG
jgi:hypothetical protein